MGIDRAIVAGKQAGPIKPHQMRVVILDGARSQDANLGGVNDPHSTHGCCSPLVTTETG